MGLPGVVRQGREMAERPLGKSALGQSSSSASTPYCRVGFRNTTYRQLRPASPPFGSATSGINVLLQGHLVPEPSSVMAALRYGGLQQDILFKLASVRVGQRSARAPCRAALRYFGRQKSGIQQERLLAVTLSSRVAFRKRFSGMAAFWHNVFLTFSGQKNDNDDNNK